MLLPSRSLKFSIYQQICDTGTCLKGSGLIILKPKPSLLFQAPGHILLAASQEPIPSTLANPPAAAVDIPQPPKNYKSKRVGASRHPRTVHHKGRCPRDGQFAHPPGKVNRATIQNVFSSLKGNAKLCLQLLATERHDPGTR